METRVANDVEDAVGTGAAATLPAAGAVVAPLAPCEPDEPVVWLEVVVAELVDVCVDPLVFVVPDVVEPLDDPVFEGDPGDPSAPKMAPMGM